MNSTITSVSFALHRLCLTSAKSLFWQ